MILQVGHSYRINLKVNNYTLSYTCVILEVDDNFFSFRDKFGKEFTYNKNLIIAIEKINTEAEVGER